MLDQEQLTDVARRVANHLTRSKHLHEDMVQEAWLRFLRYHPETRTGAWKCAEWAMLTFLRKDTAHKKRHPLIPIEYLADEQFKRFDEIERQDEIKQLLKRFQEEEPKAFAELKAYAERDRPSSGRERVRAMRARRKAARFNPAVALQESS